MIGFWCKISIELIWVAKYGNMGENHHFWSLPNTCTGTGQSCTGIGNAPFFCFAPHSYFDHNLPTSDSI